jgi:dTDP-4-amino-4,6-dideoxygalactose transaminase
MITTPDPALAARLRRLREHGMDVSAAQRHASRQPVLESYLEVGFNYRMTDVQAAIGLVQLGKLPRLVARRRTQAERYHRLLGDIRGLEMIRDPDYGLTNYQSFWVLLPDDVPVSRDDILLTLAEEGISARRGIMAAHLEPAYASARSRDLPVTERLTARSLILPLFHDLTEDQQDLVVARLRAALGHCAAGHCAAGHSAVGHSAAGSGPARESWQLR